MIAVTVLVNARTGSALERRARRFSRLLGDQYRWTIVTRMGNRIFAVLRMLIHLLGRRPDVVYVLDLAVPGVIAGSICKLVTGSRLIIESGDDIYELARSMGRRGGLVLSLTAALQLWAIHYADLLVARGFEHLTVLREKGAREVAWLPDGVDVEEFGVPGDVCLRSSWAPDDELVVAVLGSIIWNNRLGVCYGWDLVDALGLLRDKPIRGVIIGDGSGRARLEQRCIELGVRERIAFVGLVDHDQLPRYLSSVDVCLSTQTNDAVGRVRTTGKLPLYMAAGKFILATRVGEAGRILPEEMLLDFRGSHDPLYPSRLAVRLEHLLAHRELIRLGATNRALARERYDYRVLAPNLQALLDRIHDSASA